MTRLVLILFTTVFILTGCNLNDSTAVTPPPDGSFIKKIAEYSTEVSEPSGLTLGRNGKCLWTVSDNTNHVYKISLEGKVLKELSYNGDDLEGIVYDKRDGSLWVVEEQLRQIVHIDTNGAELGRFDVTNLEGSGNSGLEGICLDNNFSFYVLNEKKPRLWAKLDSSFKAVIIKKIEFTEDLSGICSDTEVNKFWLVSDQSKMLFLWSPETGVLKSAKLDFPKAEGIAIDFENGIVYIVSDETGKLYVFKLK